MKKQKNLLPGLCHFCDINPTPDMGALNCGSALSRLRELFFLTEAGEGIVYSPLHIAAGLPTTRNREFTYKQNVRVSLGDGVYTDINYIIDRTNILVLPDIEGAKRVARLWAYAVAYAAKKNGSEYADNFFAFILVKPGGIKLGNTSVEQIYLVKDIEGKLMKLLNINSDNTRHE